MGSSCTIASITCAYEQREGWQWRGVDGSELLERSAHGVELLVDKINVIKICDQLTYDRTVCHCEDLSILQASMRK